MVTFNTSTKFHITVVSFAYIAVSALVKALPAGGFP